MMLISNQVKKGVFVSAYKIHIQSILKWLFLHKYIKHILQDAGKMFIFPPSVKPASRPFLCAHNPQLCQINQLSTNTEKASSSSTFNQTSYSPWPLHYVKGILCSSYFYQFLIFGILTFCFIVILLCYCILVYSVQQAKASKKC